MRLLIIFSSLFLFSCSSVVNVVKERLELQDAFKQHSIKYLKTCQKEGFSYFPVAIVVKQSNDSIVSNSKSVTCNTYGNTTNCKESSDYSALVNAAKSNINSSIEGAYDANKKNRDKHINNCLESLLSLDSDYIDDINAIKQSYK